MIRMDRAHGCLRATLGQRQGFARRRSSLLGVTATAFALWGFAASPAVGCEVTNSKTHETFTGSLQEAVDHAAKGSTLYVSGTCEGDTVAGGKMTIKGESAATTVLKGDGSGPALSIPEGQQGTIEDVTITGGSPGIQNSGQLTLKKSTVSYNEVTHPHAETTIEAGGIENYSIENVATAITLVNSTVSHNTARVEAPGSEPSETIAEAYGGGIYSANAALILEDSSVIDNTVEAETRAFTEGGAKYGLAMASGGGIYFAGGLGSFEVYESTVSDNQAKAEAPGEPGATSTCGGGIVLGGEFDPLFSLGKSIFQGNEPEAIDRQHVDEQHEAYVCEPVSEGGLREQLAIETNALPEAAPGQPYSVQLTAAGGAPPYKWKKATALPKGLKLSKQGLLSGKPSTKLLPGTYEVAVTAQDSAKPKQSFYKALTLHIS